MLEAHHEHPPRTLHQSSRPEFQSPRSPSRRPFYPNEDRPNLFRPLFPDSNGPSGNDPGVAAIQPSIYGSLINTTAASQGETVDTESIEKWLTNRKSN